MDREPGLSLVILSPLARALEEEGLANAAAFLAVVGVKAQSGFDQFVRGSRVGRALWEIAERAGNRAIGLSMARRMPSGSFGTFDHAVWTGGTLRDAIARSSHFYGLVTEGVSLAVEEHGTAAHVSMHAPKAARHGTVLTDVALALNVLRAREATSGGLRLSAVRFRHRAVDRAPYEGLFEAPASFSQPIDEVVFDARMLALPVRSPDLAAALRIDKRAARMLEHLESDDPLLYQVRAAALRGVWVRSTGLPYLAKQLGIGPRTLQRELKARAISHTRVVDEVRRELAIQLLTREASSILEVAYEVGFSRLQAFYRAFARWTGTTPGAFRAGAVPASVHRRPGVP
jgi:AraC-like DNA-binding protein